MAKNDDTSARQGELSEPGAGQTGARRYRLHQKMISIGNDYWIENEQGEKVYKIDGKVGIHKSFNLEDARGNRLAKVHKVLVSLKETMEIAGASGEQIATVKKDLITPLREHFVVKVTNGPDLEIQGNILDHEYSIGDGERTVAEVSKKLFNIRELLQHYHPARSG